MAELDEVPHGGARAAVLVDRHDERAARGDGRHRDDRDGEVESAHHLEHGDVDHDEHDRVDALAQQRLDERPHAGRVVVERASTVSTL